MTFETVTSLPAPDVLSRAKLFFSRRIPQSAAFPERETDAMLVLRGQGGEEIVFATMPAEGGTRVRGSTMLFGQAINRFFTTLP
jgi:hypothetical protein